MNNQTTFRIEELAPMNVAYCQVMAENPETKAFKKLNEWAESIDALQPATTRFFGFNDPCPKPGQTVYQYEAWMTVTEEVSGEGDIRIKRHPGGMYAVVDTPLPIVGKAWDDLADWAKKNGYKYGAGPALEEPLTNPVSTSFEEAVLRLYFPIQTVSR